MSSNIVKNALKESRKATTHHVELSVIESDLPEIVHDMLSLGADINDRDDENRTPLHLAVQANRYKFAKELIIRGADMMVKIATSFIHSFIFKQFLSNEGKPCVFYL